MDEVATFATKEELEQVRKEQNRMAIQLEANTHALVGLTTVVAELSENVSDLSERTVRLEAKVDALEAKVDALDVKMDRRFDTLTSVIMGLRKP